MSQTIQNTVTIYNAAGVNGDLSFDGPIRAKSWNLYSNGTPNIVGYAFTESSASSPNPANAAPNGATATVGGTGPFAGILMNPKEYGLGITGTALAPSLTLPDYSIGDLLTMGEIWVNLPGPANPGDLVTYDPLTGALNSITPTTKFTASIAAGGSATEDVMTVTAVSAGTLSVGQLVSGAGVLPGTYIASFGTGKGFTGTYNLTTINLQTVSSEAMTAPNAPVPAFVGDGYIVPGSPAGTAESILDITTATSGDLLIGQLIVGTGIPANTVIIGYDGGVGGTGNYYLNQVNLTVGSSGTPIAITSPSNLLVPHAEVGIYGANAGGGVASIKLTN